MGLLEASRYATAAARKIQLADSDDQSIAS